MEGCAGEGIVAEDLRVGAGQGVPVVSDAIADLADKTSRLSTPWTVAAPWGQDDEPRPSGSG